MIRKSGVHDEQSVASLYQSEGVAATYIQKRFGNTWGRLLHRQQVAEVNRVISMYQPQSILEIAPGPARIAVDLHGVREGILLDNSQQMLDHARQRLVASGLDTVWEIRHGNAFDLSKLERKFDFLYTFRFMRHFQREERARLYQNITACLASEGFFMLDVVNKAVRQKLDEKHPTKPPGELDIYDETYTAEAFRQEMQAYGFHVLRLLPILAHFIPQSWVSARLDHRCPAVSEMLVRALEYVPSSGPLEWVALCQKAA